MSLYGVNMYVINPLDPKKKAHISKAASNKKKTSHGKNEAERKRVGKKASAVTHIHKRPGNAAHTSLFK